MTWTSEELRAFAASDDLHIAPLRDDVDGEFTAHWAQKLQQLCLGAANL